MPRRGTGRTNDRSAPGPVVIDMSLTAATLLCCPATRSRRNHVPSRAYSQLIAWLAGLVLGCTAAAERHAGVLSNFPAVLAAAVALSTSRFGRGHGGLAVTPIVDHNM